MIPALLVTALIVFFGGKAWIDSYLGSTAFQSALQARLGQTLHAEVTLQPLRYSAMNLHSDGLVASGTPSAPFAGLQLQQARAELSLSRFFDRIWQVDRLEVQRLAVQLDGARISPTSTPSVGPEKTPGMLSGFLPNRMKVGSAFVRDANVSWTTAPEVTAQTTAGIGSLRSTSLEFAPKDGGWGIEGRGGTLVQDGFPKLEVARMQLRYRAPSLYVQQVELRHGTRGTLDLTGEVRFDDALDLQAKFAGISVEPLLAPDWRARLHGELAGEATIRSRLPASGTPSTSGTVRLVDGILEALPVLEKIALFTRMQQFRRLALNTASADFQHHGSRLRVTNLVVESANLLRVEGNLTVVREQIDGVFQVGITPAALQWLPGSQERVFTESRAGYLWAPMRLTGPLRQPEEDLSARLTAAAGGALIDTLEKTVRDPIQTGKDAVGGVLDLLSPLLR